MASPQSKKDALNESQDLSVFVQGMLDEMVRRERSFFLKMFGSTLSVTNSAFIRFSITEFSVY
jgi:hypothetical protein